jgi:Ca-activated chloride channel homolog
MFSLAVLALGPQQIPPDQPVSEAKESPASIGILIDNSKSMSVKRNAAVAALEQFVRTGNPANEFFVTNFNDMPYLDQDFTTNVELVVKALQRADARGGTALYDALFASAEHLKMAAKYKKRILVLITDGNDNASRFSSTQMLAELKKPDGPVIYCIGMFTPKEESRGRKVLNSIAQTTGGAAFYPRNPHALDETVLKLAQQIRKQAAAGAP